MTFLREKPNLGFVKIHSKKKCLNKLHTQTKATFYMTHRLFIPIVIAFRSKLSKKYVNQFSKI